ncbi:hypothetical protein RRG08_013923 [Elysia crispata]|uniref:Uncharacterized protein n=1 Tax=Elysia crispata TaxID=231223 RepID=A0AAE1B213_9GAST|nr:hypothetical protein RRG08_013923 [Elysia crispata]
MPGTSQLSIPRTLFYPKNTLLSQEHSSIPRTLVLSGNLTANWEVFTRYWTHYKIASKLKTEEPEVRKSKLTLAKCIDLARSYESSKRQAQTMHENSHSPIDDQMIKKVAMRKQHITDPYPYDQKRGRTRVHAVHSNDDEIFSVQEQDCDEAWVAGVFTGRVESQSILIINDLDVRFTLVTGAGVNTICQRFVRRNQVKIYYSEACTMEWNKSDSKRRDRLGQPLAITAKSNGDIRVCMDTQELNSILMFEHYKLPNLDDVLVEMKEARIFFKLDIKEDSRHIRYESSLLTEKTFEDAFEVVCTTARNEHGALIPNNRGQQRPIRHRRCPY